MEIEEGVIRQGRRTKRITPSEISIILHMIRKPNSIIVLLFIQNNSQFKNIAKTSLPASMLSLPSIVFVQVCPAPQIFSKQQTSPSELSSCCFCYVFSPYFAQFQLVNEQSFINSFKFEHVTRRLKTRKTKNTATRQQNPRSKHVFLSQITQSQVTQKRLKNFMQQNKSVYKLVKTRSRRRKWKNISLYLLPLSQ